MRDYQESEKTEGETSAVQSCFYKGVVRHRRFSPKKREFAFKLFYPFLDIDTVSDTLKSLPLWSTHRWSPFRFRRKDYFDRSQTPLGESIRDLVLQENGQRSIGKIMLLANVRTWGINFNPLAIYFCYSENEPIKLECIVLEVTNTPWNDRHFYVIDASSDTQKIHHSTFNKAMYVSPFIDSQMEYELTYSNPDKRFTMRLDVKQEGITLLDVDLWLERVGMNAKSGITLPLRYPLLPLQVLTGIYMHAMILFFRHIRVYRRPRMDNVDKITHVGSRSKTKK